MVHAGAATIYDAGILNLGLAVGFNQLPGPNGSQWLYQRKPWCGILCGLELK